MELRYRKHTYRSAIDRIALKSITIPRPFDNEADAVHDPVHEPVHGDSRQSNDTTVSAAFVLDLACICPLDIHTATPDTHRALSHTPCTHTLAHARTRAREQMGYVYTGLAQAVSNGRNNLPLWRRVGQAIGELILDRCTSRSCIFTKSKAAGCELCNGGGEAVSNSRRVANRGFEDEGDNDVRTGFVCTLIGKLSFGWYTRDFACFLGVR